MRVPSAVTAFRPGGVVTQAVAPSGPASTRSSLPASPPARPVHVFAFARFSDAPATTAQLADHLGITKQATSELVHGV